MNVLHCLYYLNDFPIISFHKMPTEQNGAIHFNDFSCHPYGQIPFMVPNQTLINFSPLLPTANQLIFIWISEVPADQSMQNGITLFSPILFSICAVYTVNDIIIYQISQLTKSGLIQLASESCHLSTEYLTLLTSLHP